MDSFTEREENSNQTPTKWEKECEKKKLWIQNILLLKKLRQIKNVGSQKKFEKKIWFKFFRLQLSPGQMMHGQVSPWQLYPDNLLLKFGEDLISRRRDTGPQTLMWSVGRFLTIIIPLCGPTCKLTCKVELNQSWVRSWAECGKKCSKVPIRSLS